MYSEGVLRFNGIIKSLLNVTEEYELEEFSDYKLVAEERTLNSFTIC